MLYNQSLPFQQVILPFSKKAPEIVENLRKLNSLYFPEYFEEIRGIADGANLPTEWIFLLNVGVELENYATGPSGKGDKQCSDVFVSLKNFRTRTAILGHNEDADPYTQDYDYLVKSCIKTNDQAESFVFVAYHYAGQLPGNAFAWTKYLALSTNAQFPLVLPKAGYGLGRNFVNRKVYESKTIAQVTETLSKFSGMLASGFASNVAPLYDTQSSALYEMRSFENAPRVNNSIAMSMHSILPFNVLSSSGQSFYFHVNMYRNLSVPEFLDPSSVHRTARFNQFTKIETEEQVLALLGDTYDKEFPIYRQPTKTDDASTVATVLFNLITRKVTVYNKNPKTSQPIHHFNWLTRQ